MNLQWETFELQQPITAKILKQSVEKKRISHAYLASGEAAVLDKSIGILMTQLFMCVQLEDNVPCGKCTNCQRIEKGIHPDVFSLVSEERTIKKEAIEKLNYELQRTGLESKKKVFLIYEPEKLTPSAANRLLKSIEEPIGEFYFIFFSAYPDRILRTITSRCQLLHLLPIQKEKILSKLLEEYEDFRSVCLAIELTGSYEQSKSLLETEWFAPTRNLVLKLNEVLTKDDATSWIFLRTEWLPFLKENYQIKIALNMLSILYRDLMYLEYEEEDQLLFTELLERKTENQRVGQKRRMKQLLVINEAEKKLNAYVQPSTLMELLVKDLQEV